MGCTLEQQNKHLERVTEVMNQDNVNSPSHYTSGNIETIEIIKEVISSYTDPFEAYCIGNVTKYITRAELKGNSTEDLEKARNYLDKVLEERKKKDDSKRVD